jgi:hypothetical protein
MVTPQLKKVLENLKGNDEAISFMYGRLFTLRPDLKEEYYERVCSVKMFDKALDIMLGDFNDSEITVLREIHGKLNLTRREFQLYTTMLIDTAISYSNKHLDKKTLRALYVKCDELIKIMVKK